jgi:flagellar hook protein FlgE
MSLTSSLFAGVSGLNSQGSVLGVLGDNIANISTTGYKAGETTFSSLVTGDVSSGGIGSGASASTRISIDQQGIIQSTGIATDIAVSGQGFFVVKDGTESSSEILYTRAGSFRQDDTGNFINAAGFSLQAYPLDNEGRLPGADGNTNTTSSQLLDSLVTVNTRDLSGTAFATSNVSLGLNLDAGQQILTGAGDTIEPISTSENNSAASTQLLLSNANLVNGDELDVTLGNGITHAFQYGGFALSEDITANSMFASSTAAGVFNASVAVGVNFLADDHAFTITSITEAEGTVSNTFTFNQASANATLGTFNSLNSLAAAINAKPELSASVVDNQLIISPTDARGAMAFADVAASGSTMIATGSFAPGGATTFADTASTSANRFSSMAGLSLLVQNQTDGQLSSSISSPASDSAVNINVNDPLSTIVFSESTTSQAAAGNAGNILLELGMVGAAATDNVSFNPIYDTLGATGGNMASGEISPAFSRNVRVFDGQGTGHDLRVSFAKAADNNWLVEVYAANASEIVQQSGLADGQLAVGTIKFNGDGSLQSVSSALTDSFTPVWANESEALAITLDLGTAGSPASQENATNIGLTDGLSQFSGPYTVQFAEQNGAGSGLLSSVEINADGFVVANFTNGQSRNVFKIPLASFPNVNGLTPRAGNVYAASDRSGEFSLNVAGDSGVGVISTKALEGANVELADELTKIIVAQRAFQANTKIITTADELLEELNRL